MPDILDTILEKKREEVQRLSSYASEFRSGRSQSNRGFINALDCKPQLGLIAEVKKASPSKGIIRDDFDHVAIAKSYESGKASAVSVLTDEQFFKGSKQFLLDIQKEIQLPILRKDFIIDPLQVEETAHMNADGMLLIVAALSDGQMEELYSAALELELDPLIEIHNGHELERAMRLEPKLIGINNRNLKTFKTTIQTTIELIPEIPNDRIIVSESGIFTGKDTRQLMDAGAHAILVGESLMRQDDPKKLIAELRHS